MIPRMYRRFVLMYMFLATAFTLQAGDQVLNARLSPHWTQDGNACWYRCELAPKRHRFILVDAVAGTRVEAFDHVAMATALGTALGRALAADALPVSDLAIVDGGRTLVVTADGHCWETPRDVLALRPSQRSVPGSAGRTPRDTGEATALTIVNRTAAGITLDWSDFAGRRKRYAQVPPGGESRQHTYAGHVWIISDATGRILGVVEAGAGGQRVEIDGQDAAAQPVADVPPNRSPDGAWEAFIRDDDLWLRPLDGGVPIILASDGTREHAYHLPVAWSPDSSHLVARRVRAGQRRTITLIESSPEGQVQPAQRVIRYDKPGDRIDEPGIRLFRVGDRREIPLASGLPENPWSIDDLAWRADSSAFTLCVNQRGHQLLRVLEFARDGSARVLIDERSATFIDYAGKSFSRRLDGGGGWLWMSERDGWNHLYWYDQRTGMVKNQVTRGAWVVRSVEHVDEQAGLIWFTAGGMVPGEDPYQLHYCRVAFDGSGLTRLTDGDGTHTVQWSPDRRWLIDTWSRVDAAPRHVLRDGTTGRAIVDLETADDSALRASGWQVPERFVAKGRDGATDIHGVLWRPAGFDPAKHYPVVECIYAGPHAAHVPKAFRTRYAQQEIADLGFVVGMIDGMGTSYRSKAFHDVCWKNLGDAGFPDRIPWWKAAATSRPWLDLSRVGIYGGSAGGQNALGALLSHPEFYQVAVADCGCHDNRMDKIWWNELWMGWPVGPHYAEQSNVTNAHKLKGRLMLIVGELDDNVDPQSTHQVAHALEKAGKDFELVVVHGTGHGAAETPFGKKKRAGFLVRHLLGREP